MRPIGASTVARWRALHAADVLVAVADYAKQDATFLPTGHADTTRWNVVAGGGEFELILTGPKFWDTRSRSGGGGAIDLVMHLFGGDFRAAAARLRAANL